MGIINIYDKSLFYIGGVVRDSILGINSFDIDITYVGNAIDYCKKFGEVIQENPDFGTVRVNVDGKIIDFASTRSETYDKKGHLPRITQIGCSLKEDVLRRDFTINALAMNTESSEIIDYVGGLSDIRNKLIRVLHNESFIDDPTRIIRALKFRVRFGFDLENNTKKLQNDYISNINYDMSYKRVKKELMETFNLNSQKAFELFVKEGIYKLVSSENFELPDENIEELIKKYPVENTWLVYVGLLTDLSNLELTKQEKKIIDDFKNLGFYKSDFEIYKAFNDVATESILMYAIMRDKSAAEKYLNKLSKIKLEITGDDLCNLGLKPSPMYQKIFDDVLRVKIANPSMTKEDEINIVKSLEY